MWTRCVNVMTLPACLCARLEASYLPAPRAFSLWQAALARNSRPLCWDPILQLPTASTFSPSTSSILPQPDIIPPSTAPKSDLQLPLHLLRHTNFPPTLLPGENILPRNHLIPPSQNLLTHTRTSVSSPERHGPPFSLPCNLQLHLSPDRLRHAVCAAQSLHAQSFARGFPVLEARFEGVRGDGEGRRVMRRWGEAGSEGVE